MRKLFLAFGLLTLLGAAPYIEETPSVDTQNRQLIDTSKPAIN
jgi:hypothetical protein